MDLTPREQLKIMIAKFFLVEGENSTIGKMAFFFALKQNWFTNKDSKILLNKAVEMGLLEEKEGEQLRPTFSIDDMDIPAVFSPSENLIDLTKNLTSSPADQEEDTLMNIVTRIRGVTGGDVKSAIREINQKQKDTGFSIEVAALLVAKFHGAPVDDLYENVKSSLLPSDVEHTNAE